MGSVRTKSLRHQLAAHAMHAAHDSSETTKAAREARDAQFERQVDPNGELSLTERRRRAAHARKAHMLQLAYRSAKVRAAKAGGSG